MPGTPNQQRILMMSEEPDDSATNPPGKFPFDPEQNPPSEDPANPPPSPAAAPEGESGEPEDPALEDPQYPPGPSGSTVQP